MLAFFLLILGTLFVIARVRLDDWAREEIVSRLRSELGADARLGELRIRLWKLEAEFADLEVRIPPERGGTLWLEAPAGRVRFAWSGLAGLRKGDLHLRELSLTRPRLRTDGGLFERGERERREEPLPLDLRVDRLEIEGGRWRHEEREVPVDLDLSGLDLDALWSADRRTMLGSARIEMSFLRRPLAEPLRLQVQSSFRWRGQRLDLFRAEGRSPELAVDLSARLIWHDGFRMEAEGSTRADLDRLGPLFESSFPFLRGRAEGEFTLRHEEKQLQLSGDFSGSRIWFQQFHSFAVRTHADYRPGSLVLSELDAEAYGGNVAGTIAVDFGETDRVSLDLNGRGLDSIQLLELTGLALPLRGEVACRVALEGEPSDRRSWDGQGTFDAVPPPEEAPGVAFSGNGAFEIAEGLLSVEANSVSAGEALLDVSMEVDLATSPKRGELQLEGETADARATQFGTLEILRSLGAGVPSVLELPIHGSGSVAARVGFGGEPDFEIDLDLRAGSWAGLDFDRVGLELSLRGERLALRGLDLSKQGERLVASGDWTLDSFVPEELDLQAIQIDVGEALPLLGWTADAAGRLSGTMHLRRGAQGANGSGRLVLEQGRAFGATIERAIAEIEVDDGMVRLREMELSGPAVRASADLLWDLDRGAGSVELTGATIDLGALERFRGLAAQPRGVLELSGEAAIDTSGAEGSFDISVDPFEIAGQALGPVSGRLDLSAAEASLRLAAGGETSWVLEGRLGLGPDLPLELRLGLDDSLLEPALFKDPPIWTRLSGELFLRGPLRDPASLVVDGSLDSGVIVLGAHRLELADRVSVRLEQGRFSLDPVHLASGPSDVRARIVVDLRDGTLEGSGEGRLDVALLSIAAPDFRGSGVAEFAVSAGGTWDRPELTGSLELSRGRLRWLRFPHTLEEVALDLSLKGSEARIDRFRGLLGGGEVRGAGNVRFDGRGIGLFALELEANGVKLKWPAWFEGVYDARLRLDGDGRSAAVAGRVDVLRGLYREEFELARVLGIGTREYSPGGLDQLPSISFDVDCSADGNVWVRNDMAQLETRFDLHLGGTLQHPELTGRFSVEEGGKFEFRNTQYRVLAGHVEFADLQRLAPYLFLNAQTTVGIYEILLRIEGTLDRFDYQLSSNPTLAQQDIIALLTSGRTLQELGGKTTDEGADFTGDLAANYFAGALTGPFEKQLKELLGLERVQIHPLMGDGSLDATTRVTVGKRISDDVMVVASSEFGANERQIYQVEWQATRKHAVSIQTDTRAGTGGSLYYSTRHWWRKQDAEAAKSSSASPYAADSHASDTEAVQVGEVSIDGVDGPQAESLGRKLPLKPGKEFRRSDLFRGTEVIRRFFVKEGRILVHVQASVLPERAGVSGVSVVYSVDPGPLVEVVLEGVEKKDERKLRARLENLWVESLFSEGLAADSTELIRRYYQERGYYAADVEYREDQPGESVRFVVDRGAPVRVGQVEIRGAERIDEERIRKQMLTRRSSLFARGRVDPKVLAEDVGAIRNLYRDQGYLNVEIEEPRVRLSSEGNSAQVLIEIAEGPRFRVKSVAFDADLPFAEESLREWAGLKTGDVYSPSALLKAESGLRAGIDGRGYPEARVRGAAQFEAERVDVRFRIEPGEPMRIDEIVVDDGLMTSQKVIRRELELTRGDLLSREELLRAQHRLYRLGIFRSVRVTHEPMSETNTSLRRVRVEVQEGKPLGLSVGLGFDTERGAQGSFSTTHDNLFGRTRTLGIQLFLSETLRRAQIVAKEPRLFGYKLPALIDYSTEHSVEPGYTVDGDSVAIRVERRLNPQWDGFLRYAYQKQDLSDIINPDAPLEDKVESVRLGNLGVGLIRDHRDDPLMPHKGTFFSLGGAVFSDLLFSQSEFVMSSGAFSATIPFRNGLTFATAVRLGLADTYGSTVLIPISERFFAGGQSTIRGFRLDEVGPKRPDGRPLGGEARLILNQELRFPLWGRFKGELFYDAGNVYFRVEDFEPLDLRHVMGIGIRFNAPFGPVRAEYGWKLDREEGESPGQFHFAIGTVF